MWYECIQYGTLRAPLSTDSNVEMPLKFKCLWTGEEEISLEEHWLIPLCQPTSRTFITCSVGCFTSHGTKALSSISGCHKERSRESSFRPGAFGGVSLQSQVVLLRSCSHQTRQRGHIFNSQKATYHMTYNLQDNSST
jgi:hypothetical protein